VFENRVLNRIFGPKTHEVTGERGKLHGKELHNLYPPLSIIKVNKSKRMRWAVHVTRMVEMRNASYIILVEKPEGK
jgi:hypothetical protein